MDDTLKYCRFNFRPFLFLQMRKHWIQMTMTGQQSQQKAGTSHHAILSKLKIIFLFWPKWRKLPIMNVSKGVRIWMFKGHHSSGLNNWACLVPGYPFHLAFVCGTYIFIWQRVRYQVPGSLPLVLVPGNISMHIGRASSWSCIHRKRQMHRAITARYTQYQVLIK